MFHFLAKVGRKPWAKGVAPTIVGVISTGYIGVHFYGHDIARDILAASTPTGYREEISKKLQHLILTTFDEVKDVFNQPLVTIVKDMNRNPPIKWFSSSSFDPITLGMSETKTGILIGLPYYYNYDKVEEMPASLFEIRSLSLFKSLKKKENQNEDLESDDDLVGKEHSQVIRVNNNTPEGREYIDSLLLSEKAKKFSIAREIFIADSYKPLALSGIMVLSGMLAISIARSFILKMALQDSHISTRLSIYTSSTLLGLTNYFVLGDATHKHYCKTADLKAINLNEAYREGAIEYFSKVIQRNKALRKLIDEMKASYDEQGNVREPLIRQKHIPLTDRLKYAKDKPEDPST